MHKIEIVAEIGINCGGMTNFAKNLILLAKKAGADCAKFQLYSVDALFPDKQIMSQGMNWFEEVKPTELTYEQVCQLAEYCKEVGIEFMASAFDIERVGWLEDVGVKKHKVASRMNNNKELIDAMFNTGKEILVSCKQRDITYAFWQPQNKRNKVKWLYCIPEYPTSLDKLGFDNINFPDKFQGFSDHTVGIEASIVAMSRGATIIEKHFCYIRDHAINPDMVCSIEADELRQLVQWARKIEEMI